MISMQTKILAAIEAAVTDAGLDPVQRARYANTGTVHAQEGFVSLLVITYSFQSTYCSIGLSGPLAETAIITGLVADNPPEYRVFTDPKDYYRLNQIHWFSLDYGTDRLVRMFATLATVLAQTSTYRTGVVVS